MCLAERLCPDVKCALGLAEVRIEILRFVIVEKPRTELQDRIEVHRIFSLFVRLELQLFGGANSRGTVVARQCTTNMNQACCVPEDMLHAPGIHVERRAHLSVAATSCRGVRERRWRHSIFCSDRRASFTLVTRSAEIQPRILSNHTPRKLFEFFTRLVSPRPPRSARGCASTPSLRGAEVVLSRGRSVRSSQATPARLRTARSCSRIVDRRGRR